MIRSRIARMATLQIAPVSIVWVVWFAWTIVLFAVVRIHGSDVPYADDYGTWTGFLTGERRWTPGELWVPHNGHRLGASFALMGLTYAATGSSILSMMYLNAVLLSASAALFVWAVRRWRGHLVATDTLIPVVLLNWGHLEVVLWAICVNMSLFLFCLSAVAVFATGRSAGSSPGQTVLCTMLLLAMTQSSGAGMIVAAAMVPWFAFAAWHARDGSEGSPDRSAAARRTLVACASIMLFVVAASWSYEQRPSVRSWQEVAFFGAPHMLANMFGCLAMDLWIFLPTPAVILVGASFAILARRWFSAPHDRRRVLASSLLLTAFCVVAAGTSRYRGTLHPYRYATLMAPVFVLVYAIWSCCGPGRWSAAVSWTMCVAAWVGAPWNSTDGYSFARHKLILDTIFVTELKFGTPVGILARSHCDHYPSDCGSQSTPRLEEFLTELHAARIGIFANLNITETWPGMEGYEPVDERDTASTAAEEFD